MLVVVATDVAARGLDIPSVGTVIHYDAPRTVDAFVHRSGRTAVRVLVFAFQRACVCAQERHDYCVRTMMKSGEFGLESLNNGVDNIPLAV